MAKEHKTFTVERAACSGYGIGEFAIRYTPKTIINENGSRSLGLLFQALLAGDLLGDAENVLQGIADLLNENEASNERV